MDWKVEKHSNDEGTTIRLIGRMQVQHLQELETLIAESGPRTCLNLEELMLVDLETVRFLSRYQKEGMSLLHCQPYIRAWMAKEQENGS